MKRSVFKKSLLIYSIVLLVLILIFLIYIFFTLKNYEYNQTGNFLSSYMTSLDDNALKGYLKEAGLEEKELNNFKNQIKNLEYKKKDDDSFLATLNNRELFIIKTKAIKEVTKLGLFTYQEREVIEVTPNLKRGLVYYDVTIPSNYTLYVDGKKYEGKPVKEDEYEGLDFMYFNESMPKLVKYEINGLMNEANLKVENFLGKEVKLKESKYIYTLDNLSVDTNDYEEAKTYIDGDIDVWNVAHTWSLFLTRDLTGAHYGLNTVREFLILGTNMDKMAYDWSHSIDITFTSRHTLKNPIWTNEKLTNFKIYSKDAFSCEVYTEKNMILTKTGEDRVDVMHDYLYFIKENGTWKLMNIKSVVDESNNN